MNQSIYKFSSADGRSIQIRGLFTKEDEASFVPSTEEYSDAYRAQSVKEQLPVTQLGIEITEAAMTAYAMANGYTLHKIRPYGNPHLLNAELAAAPTIAVEAEGSSLSNELSWTGSLRMEIWRSTEGNGNFQRVARLVSGSTGYSDTAIEDATTYYYKVRVTDTTKVGAFSNIVSILSVDNS